MWDATLADYLRMNGEKSDEKRIRRAVEACPRGVLYIPSGTYEIAEMVEITN